MRTRTLFLLLVAVPLVLWAAAAPLGLSTGAADTDAVRHPVTGVVVAHPEGAVVRIAHDDIPGFMPPMTMPFTLESTRLAEGLTPGDRVAFTLVVSPSATTAVDLRVIGRDPITLRRLAADAEHRNVRLTDGDVVPAFRLTDHTGVPVTEADLRGVVTVATFIFTRCPLPDYCPAMMARLKGLHARTRTDATTAGQLRLLAISIDPAFDTPDVLAEYARAHGVAAPDVRLLTGDRGEIDALTAAFAVVTRPSDVSIDHTLTTAVIGPDGRVAALLRGNAWSIDEALTIIRTQSGQ